ncbi:DUF3347 domain-containing protein [Pedobacter sp. KR3-3]|uniref:DUF3347 domain-containing protein n=1 Tax=Pedobacter albus TaxID=3113905 RepID=A0ABU7IAK2_9SPHI|nr:DUF3347 domain-containing protein [Pedobacter sp. KR3-3]MEE1946497.1 DUF3347 domain-containing protein [Pedobacter sp. KR3-3]
MKKLTFTLALVGMVLINAIAQVKNEPAQLLSSYYGVKDALVNGNAAEAGTKATEFLAVVKAIDGKSLAEPNRKAFLELKEKLAFDAEHISESKDIAHQRDHFAAFSTNLYALAKAVKLSGQPIYQEYCPMKKMYWLSSEQTIKNPYYGKSMLTCGKVTDTIN